MWPVKKQLCDAHMCISAPILQPLTTTTWHASPYSLIVSASVAIVVPVGGVLRWINASLLFIQPFIYIYIFFFSPWHRFWAYNRFISSLTLPYCHTHINTHIFVDTPQPSPSTLQAYLWGPASCDELRPSLLPVLSISISTPAESRGNYAPFPGMWLDSWCWQPHISVF